MRRWGPVVTGLALIPALPYTIDEPCEHVCEAAFHRLWPWVDSLNATTPGVKKGRIVDLPGQARAMIAKKKKED